MNIGDILPFFDNWKRSGNGKFTASCPMPDHDDSDPSVTLSQDIETGNILMYCWGCDTKAPELMQALGLRVSDLFGDPGNPAAIQQEPQNEEVSKEDLAGLNNYLFQVIDKLELASDYILTRFNLSVEEGELLGLGVDPGDDSVNRPEGYESFNSGTPHLIIPLTNPSGEPVGMQGRRLIPGEPRWRSKSGSGWSKIGCFGWDLDGPVILTEGLSDPLSVVGRAKLPALAVRGASLTDDATTTQIKSWLDGRKAVVIGDNGDAGEKFSLAISEKVGIPYWKVPEDYSDLSDFLGDGGTLSEAISLATIHNPPDETATTSPAEKATELVNRLVDNLDGAIFDLELMNDLNLLPSEEQDVIFARTIRRAPHGQIGDFRGFVRAIQGRLRSMPPTLPAGGVGNNVGGGPGNPLPNQPIIMWNPEDQLHVTESNVKTAMDQYKDGDYYQAAPGQYVKVVKDDLISLKDAGLRSMLSQMGHWRVISGQQEKGHIPYEAAKMISEPSWDCDVPIINRRVEVPFMLEDGYIVSEPGFHEESGIYLLPRFNDRIIVPEVPSIVTDKDVETAKNIFKDVVQGFNFTNRASESNLIAMTLTSPLRELFKNSPMVPFLTSTAPQSGSGKGTSVRVPLSTVGIGPHTLSTTAYNSDENEFEKKLVGKLLKKSTYIFLDNVRSQVNSAVLEQMLTAANYDGRTLGFSDVNSLSTLVLWVCTLQSTGSFNRDLTRRCVPVDLTKNWRGAWSHKNIDAYLAEMRGQMIWACFVSARKWMQDGGIISDVRLDGYGGWTEVIGGILENVLGYEDFLSNLGSFRKQQDEVSMTIDGMLDNWFETYGEEIRPAIAAVEDLEDPELHRLLGLHGSPSLRQTKAALERRLSNQDGYVIGTTHIWRTAGIGDYGAERNRKLYRCVPVEEDEEQHKKW